MSLSSGPEIGSDTERRFSPIHMFLRCYKLREIERWGLWNWATVSITPGTPFTATAQRAHVTVRVSWSLICVSLSAVIAMLVLIFPIVQGFGRPGQARGQRSRSEIGTILRLTRTT